MRKKHSPHGNVGPNYLGDKRDHKRCVECDYCNGIDGFNRIMTKHPYKDGYLCEKCKRADGVTSFSQEKENWYREAVEASKQTVDGERDYDEMIEDLITDWEKSQDS